MNYLKENFCLMSNYKKSGLFDLMVLILGFYLFFPTILWTGRSFSHSSNRFSSIIFLLITGLLIKKIFYGRNIKQIVKNSLRHGESRLPYISFIFSVSCYILLEIFLRINILSTAFFALSVFSLSGFYLPIKTWKKGFLPLIFFILALPFGNSLDIYLGFPMRIFTTNVAEKVLTGFGIESITKETIIIIENSAAKVDNSCSGLKGIWSGLLFYFGATFLEKKRVGIRWILYLLFFLATLSAFNILRIVILVITETVLGLTKTAEAIHIPLGITGFVFSCFIAWYLLKEIPAETENTVKKISKKGENKAPLKLYGIIIILLISGIFLTQKQNYNFTSNHKVNLDLPSFHLNPLELTDLEKGFLIKTKKDMAVKMRFNFKDLSGTILIALNDNFRRHHSPEECMKGSGLKIGNSVTRLINKEFPVKFTSLQDNKLSASYWFQSKSFTTDDFSSRVWAHISGREKKWALVSVLFERKINPSEKNIREFHVSIYKEVKKILNFERFL